MLTWRSSSSNIMMADAGDLRATVEALDCFAGGFRFTVLRRQYGQGSPFALIETGTRSRLHEAIAAAEQVLDRCNPAG